MKEMALKRKEKQWAKTPFDYEKGRLEPSSRKFRGQKDIWISIVLFIVVLNFDGQS